MAVDEPAPSQHGGTDLAEIVLGHIEAFGARLAAGVRARMDALSHWPDDVAALERTIAATGWTFLSLAVAIPIVSAATLAVFFLASRLRRAEAGSGPALGLAAGAAAASFLAGALLAQWLGAGEPLVQRVLRGFAFAGSLSGLTCAATAAALRAPASPLRSRHHPGLRSFRRMIDAVVYWALFAVAVLYGLRLFGAGAGLRDAVGLFGAVVPVTALIIVAYARSRRNLAFALAGPRPRSRLRVLLARAWPALAPALIVASLVLAQIAATLGRPLRPLALLLTILLILLGPHLDSHIKAWSGAASRSHSIPLGIAAAVRTARFMFLAAAAAALLVVWGAPVVIAAGADPSVLAWPAIEIAGIALIAAYLWNAIGVAVERALLTETSAATSHDDEAGQAPRSRLGTVLPLIAGATKASLAALAALTTLLALGINVWPLITGLSVFGLAIGFGSQTLVKDIVSGLFFLADDAFRLGEYIETSGAKGTVEKISIRSVSLRHPRGALATIPYGQISKILNFSRDWVIEKLAFRVAFETDVEKVRKLFKKIGQEIAADPELAPDLIETFKSQGIAAVEDGTLVVRGKFKARAGKQFQIRKRVLAEVQRAFQENGISAVPRPLSRDPALPYA